MYCSHFHAEYIFEVNIDPCIDRRWRFNAICSVKSDALKGFNSFIVGKILDSVNMYIAANVL